jgi:hypothetical protein
MPGAPQDRDWKVIAKVRILELKGTEIRLLEFRGEITGTNDSVSIVTDGRDVLLTADEFSHQWKRMTADELFGRLRPPIVATGEKQRTPILAEIQLQSGSSVLFSSASTSALSKDWADGKGVGGWK